MENNIKKLVLLIDDEADLLENCARILDEENYSCITTTDSTKALELARLHNPQVVITDFLMPEKNGMEVLRDIHAVFPQIPIIMFSAFATIDGVVEAVKSGAFDYLTKPFTSDQLIITVERAFAQYRLKEENKNLKEKLQADFFNHFFVGKHPRFLKTVEMIRKVAQSKSNALIYGETGTGKELAARAIHMLSDRANGPFHVVDCTTVTKEMIEPPTSTSAGNSDNAVENIFDASEGGTLYLEHVDELDPTKQAKLVRVLQDRKVPYDMGWKAIKMNVRLIASTTTDLYTAVTNNMFRENLYYFLNVVKIDIPPLRERLEDIGILCDHFFKDLADGNGMEVPSLHPDALVKMMEYRWPGNVRQLRNVLEGAVSLAEGRVILVKSLPKEIRSSVSHNDLPLKEARTKWLEQFERYYLENLLLATRGNMSKASEKAGIARMSLYRMVKRTGLHELVMHERSAEKQNTNEEKNRSEE
ncbi:MAG: sigma-54 dependent transcriptional regulator [Nitrospinota bacterium]|nr:sigma-54 dependent transcriptional regulator [Nitrospinota bacterium]